MANWPLTPNVDYISSLVFEREAKAAISKAADAGFEDPDRAREFLHRVVALCSDQLVRVARHEREADDRAREERETSVPPYSA
jgi:hypothetical protein